MAMQKTDIQRHKGELQQVGMLPKRQT